MTDTNETNCGEGVNMVWMAALWRSLQIIGSQNQEDNPPLGQLLRTNGRLGLKIQHNWSRVASMKIPAAGGQFTQQRGEVA